MQAIFAAKVGSAACAPISSLRWLQTTRITTPSAWEFYRGDVAEEGTIGDAGGAVKPGQVGLDSKPRVGAQHFLSTRGQR